MTLDGRQIDFNHIFLTQENYELKRKLDKVTEQLASVKRSKRTCKGWITRKSKTK